MYGLDTMIPYMYQKSVNNILELCYVKLNQSYRACIACDNIIGYHNQSALCGNQERSFAPHSIAHQCVLLVQERDRPWETQGAACAFRRSLHAALKPNRDREAQHTAVLQPFSGKRSALCHQLLARKLVPRGLSPRGALPNDSAFESKRSAYRSCWSPDKGCG